MKPVTKQEFPPGWNEKKVLGVVAHYDGQSEEEWAAEIEAAPLATAETLISVPTVLVGEIKRLMQNHARKAARHRSGNRVKKPPVPKGRH